MKHLIGTLLFLVSCSIYAEECHVIIKKADLHKEVMQGKEVYVVNVADVKPDQCFKPVETGERLESLQKAVDNNLKLAEGYKQNQEAVQKLNSEYAQLIQRHEQTLDRSIQLGDNFKKNTENYQKLIADYDQLTVKYDALAGKYREVALTAGSPFNLEVGAGLTNKGDGVALLGAGVHVYKKWSVKAYGLFHKDFSALAGGVSVGF